ncbi:MAG: gamma-glutamyltransferase family protein [Cyanothece sp. SIO1E1]|nr:gamma-glutamyltransferase family protein [Cyanothece sp. SIO1E1]
MTALLRRVLPTVLTVMLGVGMVLSLTGDRLTAQTWPPAHMATGRGGAVASIDGYATQVGIEILQAGGNAIDAAVATAAALGVTRPFESGIGGGDFMVVYRQAEDRVITLDGREEAPASAHVQMFQDPDDPAGGNLPFYPNRITNGAAVGVPGTVLNWVEALNRYGTMSLEQVLAPAIALAENGFEVDPTFVSQTEENQERFELFTSTRDLFLPNGQPPALGSTFTNPDLARTYRLIATQGPNVFYRGEIGQAIAQTVQNPPVVLDPAFRVIPGGMTMADLDQYEVRVRPPVSTHYRGYQIYGMGLPSSGGITSLQVLNLVQGFDLAGMEPAAAWHRILEAERLAYADRNAYLGDPEYVDVPVAGLLNPDYAEARRTMIGAQAMVKAGQAMATAGNPFPYQNDPSRDIAWAPNRDVACNFGGRDVAWDFGRDVAYDSDGRDVAYDSGGRDVACNVSTRTTTDTEGISTTHLTVADQFGNVVVYTLTIETTGGSGIVVPGYGFLLNNELTDFDAIAPHPNSPEPGKRPRSSMAPTIVFAPDGQIMAFGSPGGSTIITTVLGIAFNVIDFGMSLDDAIAFPRISQRNTATTQVDGGFEQSELGLAIAQFGHQFQPVAEIGGATGVVVNPDGTMLAAAEPFRRGGGSAMTVKP